MRLATFALLVVVACGADSTSPADSFRGDYVLQTINGQSLPYTWTFTGGNYYRLNSYRLTIIPGGSWISALDYAYTDQGAVVNRPNGGETGTFTYTPSSGFVSLISQDQTTFFTGTVSGAQMTITENGDVWVFKR
jgi:hypothetical protein